MMLLARRANVIDTEKSRSLSVAPIQLKLNGDKMAQEAILRCDFAYLQEIMDLDDPFDIEEAAIAMYENAKYAGYLQTVLTRFS